MQNVTAACILSALLQFAGLNIMNYPVPRSYYFLYGGVLFFLTLGNRFAYRFIRYIRRLANKSSEIKSVMIIGAGEAANVIIKEIISSERISNTTVKCIIDDDPLKQGTYIHGIKVVGTRDDIIDTANLFHINEIIIAMPSVAKKTIREIVEICNETGCNLKILPGVYQLMSGEVSVSKLRNVEVEDLLGRDSIEVNLDSIMGYVKDKVVLVTGGGGSIGSELCRQLAVYHPKQLIIVDIYENNAYDIQQELKAHYRSLICGKTHLSEAHEVNYIFKTYKPQMVYRYLPIHVPLIDSLMKPSRITYLETGGLTAADHIRTERFVLISTDKAVGSIISIGASKRVYEMITDL